MSLVSLICFLLALLIVLSCLRKNADIFSPGRVFGFLWAVAISLTDLKLSRFQHEWSLYSWLMTFLGLAAFFLGLYVIYILNCNKQLLTVSEIRQQISLEAKRRINHEAFFRVILIIFIAYCISFVAEVAIEGNVPLFSPRIEKARVEFGVFGLHLIVNTMLTIMILSVEYFLLVDRYKKASVTLIFIATFSSFFLLLQRYNYFVWIIIAVGLVYYLSTFFRLRNVIIGGALFFGFLSYIQSIRLSQYLQKYIYLISEMRYSEKYAIFTEPYMYIVMNLENFARGVEKLDFHTYGYFTTDFMLALTGLKHWLGEYFNIVRLPYLVSGYNTFTFSWWYYYDFGILGLAVVPFLLGSGVGFFYYRLRKEPRLVNALTYSICLTMMGISIIMNPLTRLDFVFNLFLLWLVHKFIMRR